MLPTENHIKESFVEGLTQSEIMERMNCPRKHMFRYILNLKRQGSFSWALETGGAVHKILEKHYRLMQINGFGLSEPESIDFDFEEDVILQPEQYDEYKYWRLIAGMLVWRYIKYYRERDEKLKIQSVEVPVDLTYRDFRLRGMIDLVAVDPMRGERPMIMDHKTASDLNDIRLEGWQFRFQFLFYSWLWMKVTGERPCGNYVNILKKPQERRSVKRGETVEDFCRRIDRNIIADPSEFFRREWVPLDDGILDRFEKYTLNPVLRQFEIIRDNAFDSELRESLLLVPNTDSCCKWNVRCEFLELCKNNFEDYAMEYIPRPIKHSELKRFSTSS